MRVSRPIAAVFTALLLVASACSAGDQAVSAGSAPADEGAPGAGAHRHRAGSACASHSSTNGAEGDAVVDAVEQVAREHDLTTVLYRVTRGDEVVASGAYGDTLTGIPADPSFTSASATWPSATWAPCS